MRGALIGFLVMLALGAGGSSAARLTLLREPPHVAARPPAAAVDTPAPTQEPADTEEAPISELP